MAGGDLGTGGRVHAAVTVLGDPHPGGVLRRAPAAADRDRVLAEGADLVHAQAVPDGPRAAAPSGPGWAAAGLTLLLTDRAELGDGRTPSPPPTGRHRGSSPAPSAPSCDRARR